MKLLDHCEIRIEIEKQTNEHSEIRWRIPRRSSIRVHGEEKKQERVQ